MHYNCKQSNAQCEEIDRLYEEIHRNYKQSTKYSDSDLAKLEISNMRNAIGNIEMCANKHEELSAQYISYLAYVAAYGTEYQQNFAFNSALSMYSPEEVIGMVEKYAETITDFD